MTNLCTSCEWLDGESQRRWEKDLSYKLDDETTIPAFNSSYAFCTHPAHRKAPRHDLVAGHHMDVVKLIDPPWKKCRECRWFYGDNQPCPHWKEKTQ